MFINLLNPIVSGAISAETSDEEIIALYLESNHSAYFDLLYDRYSRKVFAKCISLLKSQEQAEDATQDIFVKLLLKLGNFSGKSKFSTWLYSITYNYCIDLIRRKKKNPAVLVEDMTAANDAAEEISDSELLETNVARLKVVLEQIPVEDKSILMMKYQDDLSIKDICSVLNKSESAIKMKIKRAKEKFMRIHNEKYKSD